MSTRTCGSCAACCKTHGVSEIEKLPGRWCKFCTTHTSCDIYEKRPNECREFRCAWLAGWDEEADRPDKVGYVSIVEALALSDTTVVWCTMTPVDTEGDISHFLKQLEVLRGKGVVVEIIVIGQAGKVIEKSIALPHDGSVKAEDIPLLVRQLQHYKKNKSSEKKEKERP